TTQLLYEKPTEKHFLNGREGLAMHRSGQGLFLPRARFENKSRQYVQAPLHSRNLYVEKLKWIHINSLINSYFSCCIKKRT
ncbi:hypothetical protein V7166_15115, partial [Bacillus thuringiensis]